MEAKLLAERNAQLVHPMQTMLATRAGIFEAAPTVATATLLGLTLNLFNVFLYMTNYNVIIPMLDAFCVHLGVPNSLSGAIIGCADIMAILVSVGYSIWTNHSFKQPLIFASIVCVAGNVLVTLAYDRGGLLMLFLGRLLTGTGAARALNRRYIADFVSIEGRTSASIGFVAASAAGMALGPFLSVPLTAMLDRYGDDWKIGGLTMNVITVSGWLMVVTWAVFSIVVVLVFDEPLQKKINIVNDSAATAIEGPSEAFDVFVDHDSVPDQGSVTEPLLSPSLSMLAPDDSGSAISLRAIVTSKKGQQATVHLPFEESAASNTSAAALGITSGVTGPEEFEDADSSDGYAAAEHAAAALEERSSSAGVWSRLATDLHLLPTIACTLMLFLLKLLQQGSVSAVPLFTIEFYHWDMSTVGLFMAAMSLAMLPLNFSVAALTPLVRCLLLPAAGAFVLASAQGSLAMTIVADTHRLPCALRGPAARLARTTLPPSLLLAICMLRRW
jgi:hypothetical protein